MAIRPVIFIGLGSTGAKIVSRIYENIELNREVDPWIKPFYKYLGINSEAICENGVNPNLDVFHLTTGTLNSEDVITALDNNINTREEFRKLWYSEVTGKHWIPAVELSEGVGGCRIFGPTLLRHRSFDLANSLPARLQSLSQAIMHARQALPPQDQNNVNCAVFDCHIFGILAGGTCSGSLFDIALLIKQTLGLNTRLSAELLLGDVCYDGMSPHQLPARIRFAQHWNTCFALAELSLVLSKTGFDIVKREWPRHIGNITLNPQLFNSALFNSVTLVGAHNDANLSFNTGGNQFPKYQQFMADYFSKFFKSAAAKEMEGRNVDNQIQISDGNDSAWPSRPNRFARLGYVCVQVPREKIVASLEMEISEVLGLQYFRNADPDRVSQGENSFLERTNWELLLDDKQSPFAPPAGTDPMIVADNNCPATADDFESAWSQTCKLVKDFYASWMTCHSVEASTAFNAFGGAWKQSLDTLMADYCGQNGRSISLGSLEILLEKRLIPRVEALITEVTKALPGLQRLMSETSNAFESALAEAKDDLPGRINVIKRKYWSGGTMMAEALTAYRDGLRRYAILKLLGEALPLLLRDLQGMAAVRKLIASYSAGEVFESKRAREQNSYSVPVSQTVEIEVIKDRGEIFAQLVTPLLSRTSGNATLKENAVQRIASAWAGSAAEGQEGIFAYFLALCELLRGEEGNLDPQNLAIRSPYSANIERIRTMLDARFTEQCDSVFKVALSEITVWDTIRQYVEQQRATTKQTAERILTGLFQTYMEHACLFTPMNGKEGGDAAKATNVSSLLYYLCNQTDAVRCFSELGVQNPHTYLNTLMSNTALGGVNPLNVPDSRDSIQLFQQRMGELPYFYKEFEAVAGLLRNPPVSERGTERFWSDARFPEWIAQWHANKKNPPYWVGGSQD